MTCRLAAIVGVLLCALLLAPAAVSAQAERYFSIWHYANNEPAEEFDASKAGEQTRGYWRVEFDDGGGVTGATYYDSRGNRWLSYEYVEVDGRVVADLYGASGDFIHRKGTRLSSRTPRLGVAGK